ncbi:MAG: hypothetical protein EAZ53_10680 [Bacteroidetes bacterium]|nr:MAG: hypothetical protein EAZ53_10680 [Bacteroidota bacterium]
MKKYLEENIKFNTARFTSIFQATVLLIGAEIGLILNGNLKDNKILLTVFAGIILIMFVILYLLNLQNNIKEDILKLKSHE